MLFCVSFDEKYPKYYRTAQFVVGEEVFVSEVGYNRVPKGVKQIFKRDVYIIHYVVLGKGTFNGEKIEAGYVYVTVPQMMEITVSDKDDPFESYWIMFKGEEASKFLKSCHLPEKGGVVKFEDSPVCAGIIKRSVFDINAKNDFEEACLMKSAFYEIVSRHARLNTEKYETESSTAVSVKNYIKGNFHHSITVNSIASQYNFTRNYLYILFKKEYGISPKEYLLNLRIKKAKQLLSEDIELSVGEIANSVGFENQLYFSRCFKQKTDLSPTEYRRKNLK